MPPDKTPHPRVPVPHGPCQVLLHLHRRSVSSGPPTSCRRERWSLPHPSPHACLSPVHPAFQYLQPVGWGRNCFLSNSAPNILSTSILILFFPEGPPCPRILPLSLLAHLTQPAPLPRAGHCTWGTWHIVELTPSNIPVSLPWLDHKGRASCSAPVPLALPHPTPPLSCSALF